MPSGWIVPAGGSSQTPRVENTGTRYENTWSDTSSKSCSYLEIATGIRIGTRYLLVPTAVDLGTTVYYKHVGA